MQSQIAIFDGKMVVVRPVDNAVQFVKIVKYVHKNVHKNIFDFMGLPAEIRNMIYECISDDKDKVKNAIAIIRVSRKIRREALPVIYGDLTLNLDVDLEHPCRYDIQTLPYPLQSVPESCVYISCGVPDAYGRYSYYGAEMLSLASADGTLNILSHLRDINVSLYEKGRGEDAEEKGRFRVRLDGANLYKAAVGVNYCGKYNKALAGLLKAEVSYWTKRHGHGRFCEDFLNRLFEPAEMIQRAMWDKCN